MDNGARADAAGRGHRLPKCKLMAFYQEKYFFMKNS